MLTRLRHLLIRTAALVALVVLLAGPMLLVARLVGRPLPTGDQLRRAWHGGELDWRVAAKLAAAAFWLLWSYLTAIALTEAAQVRRGRAPAITPRHHFGGFGLTPIVRYLVRTVLAAGITVTTIIPIAATVAARPATPPAAALAINTVPAPAVANDTTERDTATVAVTASGRDTPYSIAVRCCHDPAARDQILKLNRGRLLPDGSGYDGGTFPAGWTVLVPADRGVVDTTSATSAGDSEFPIAIPDGDHIVERGDNLWTIAKHHLQDAGLPTPSERQVADYWRTTIGDNQPHLASGNPNLIYPGEDITLPAAGPAPAPPLEPTAPPPTAPPPAPPPTPTPTTSPSSPALPPPTVVTPTTAIPPSTAPTSTPPTVPATPVGAPVLAPGGSEPVEHTADDHQRQLVLWTGGTVLATGAVVALTRNRRRRLATGRPPPHYHPDIGDRDLELALRTASQPDHLAWATTVLRDLGTLHRPRPGQPQPACVQLTPDAIDILWTAPTPDPPPPWRSGDAGWSWHRDRHRDDPITSDRTAPCPTLVTIGTRPDNPDATILVHLETAGTLHLPENLTDLARGLVHELATTPFADDIDILLTDPTLAPATLHGRVRTAPLSAAVTWAQARTADTRDNLHRRHHDSAFAARLTNTSLDGYQPIVIITTATDNDPELLDQLITTCQPGTGASAIILGGTAQPWTITPADAGHVHFEPLDLDLIPVGLTSTTGRQLDDVLANARCDATDDAASTTNEVALVLADEPADLIVDDVESDAFAEETFDVEVHVLGQVHVTGVSQHLRPGEIELLAYLTLHTNGDTADTIMTQLWPTQPAAPKTFRNRATNLRTKLGAGRDGRLLFPESRDTGLYRASNLVTSDLDRFRARVHHAEHASSSDAIELLTQALALVNGPPFRATAGYDWAYAEQIEDQANHDIQHAACRLAELALEAEDPHTALWAAAQAKLALGVLAAEPLGRLEMLAHAHDGNTAAITDVYRELQTALERHDPANDPAPETTALYRRLVGDPSAPTTSNA